MKSPPASQMVEAGTLFTMPPSTSRDVPTISAGKAPGMHDADRTASPSVPWASTYSLPVVRSSPTG